VLAKTGPGLITGASDDDPSGIAADSQVGSQCGPGLLWTMLYSYPLQAVSRRSAPGRAWSPGAAWPGTSDQRAFPARSPLRSRGLAAPGQTIIIGADIGAMAAALHLVVEGPLLAYTLGFGLLCVGLRVFIS
jgi:Mn2+/Fe2+ NRAMP family transporter